MNKLTTLSLTLAAAITVGCAQAETKPDYDQARAAAEAARKSAAAMGYEWRDTAKILKAADEAAGKGDMDKAMKLAKKAQAQGDAAVAQAKQQEMQWRDAVPK